MHIVNPPEMLQQLTRTYTGERFSTGRPRVADDLLNA